MKKKLKYIILLSVTIILIFSGINVIASNFKLIYVVQQGDTISEIAYNYDISVEELKKVNNLDEDSWIKVGDELIIPYSKNEEKNKSWNKKLFSHKLNSTNNNFSFAKNSTYSIRVNDNRELPEVNIPSSQIVTYHVSVGDTLYDLARDFNTSIGVIMVLNNMENSIIRNGDDLKLPINNLSSREVIAKTINEKDIDLLARIIFAEARGEPFMGQVAVGAVVINRVLSSYFPDDFYEVIYQSRQFTAVSDGQINLTPNNTAYRAAKEALKGKDPTMGALYYYNPKIAENKWWFATRKHIVTIGDHVFAR